MGVIVLTIFIICSIYVQYRGSVRHDKLRRKITDHSNFLAPINCLFYMFSRVKKSAYIDVSEFPELKILEQNWETIRDEALSLNDASQIKSSKDLDDLGFNSFFRTGWKRFYLKWYGANLKSASYQCPKTIKLLSAIPTVKGAMFAMLPPGARLMKHRDPYAGSLRYHLGLVTPNSEDCHIYVDGKKYSWKDGESVMFDETFIHYAENKTNQNRIILFLDIKRPVSFFLIDWVNNLLSYTLLSATATKNTEGDKVGFLNKIFSSVYKIRILGKKIKSFNSVLYYMLQYGLYLYLVYIIFL